MSSVRNSRNSKQVRSSTRASELAGIRIYLLQVAERLGQLANAVEARSPGSRLAGERRRWAQILLAVCLPGQLERLSEAEIDLVYGAAAFADPLTEVVVVPARAR